MRQARNIFIGFYIALALVSCTNLARLETFEDRAGYAALLTTRVATLAADRYEQGALSKDRATDILRGLKNSQEALELAQTAFKAGSFKDADVILATAIVVLTQLERDAQYE